MSVAIEDEGTPVPKWRRVEKINLNDVVEFCSQSLRPDGDEDEDSWILKGHSKELEDRDSLPLWRIRVTSPILHPIIESSSSSEKEKGKETFTFTLAFYFHHAIGDGLSGCAFHITFLSALNTLLSNPSSISDSNSNSNTEIITPPKLTLLPTLEMTTKLPLTWYFILVQIIKTFIYSPLDAQSWSGPPIKNPPILPAIGNQKSFEIEADVVKKLVQRCRDEKTTITSLITVLVARKLAIMNPRYTHFSGTIPFSLRKFTRHTNREIGNFISNIILPFSVKEEGEKGYIYIYDVSPSSSSPLSNPSNTNIRPDFKDFKSQDNSSKSQATDEKLWISARETKDFIFTNTSSPRNQMVGLLGFVQALIPFFLAKFGKRREFGFEISNLGVVDGGILVSLNENQNQNQRRNQRRNGRKEKERVIFDKILFSGSICTYAEPFGISIATVRNGIMTIAVRWERGVMSDGDGRELAGWLEGVLGGLGGF